MVSATAMTRMTSARPTLRCVHCKLVQYPTVKGDCRKCHKNPYELEAPKPAPVPVVVEQVASRWARSISSQAFSDNVGNAIKLLRLAAGYSQNNFAKRMGVNRTWLTRIEHGHISPTLKSFRRFATAFGVSPWFLAEAVEYLSAQHSLEEIPDDK